MLKPKHKITNNQRLKPLLRTSVSTSARSGGFTYVEVLASAMLVGIAVVSLLQALVGAYKIGTESERITQSISLAVRKTEEIRAASLESFINYGSANTALGAGYLCTVSDSDSGVLKTIKIQVGFDVNGNNILDGSEILATLDAMIADRR